MGRGSRAKRSSAYPPRGFVLGRQGIDAGGRAAADDLARAYPPVSLGEALDGADRHATGFEGALEGRARGYRWDAEDAETEDWYPQGVTGSSDADASGLVASREVHAASWYSKRGEGSRISFVDVGARRYLHALLVRPTGGGSFALVKIHAGGIAWVGDLLYVADTVHGLRVFDASRLLRTPGGGHLMAQIGAYRDEGGGLTWSYVALDRTGSPGLLAGEYAKSPGRRVVRWPIDLSTGLLASHVATDAWRAPMDRLQGAVTHQGILIVSASRRGGRLYAGRPGGPPRDAHVVAPPPRGPLRLDGHRRAPLPDRGPGRQDGLRSADR